MKKNVLHLIGSFNQGGSERQAVQIVRLLSEEGSYQIFVACLNNQGVLRGEIEQLGFTDIPEFPLNTFYDANMWRQLWRCAKFIRENNVEIIQSHDFYTNIFGMTAGAMAKLKVRIAAKRETGTKTKVQRFVERRAFDLSHAIVANADGVKKYLVDSGVAARKIVTIYNGLDLERLIPTETNRKQILQKFDLPTDREMQFVTIVANLRSEVKNHRMFLRAARTVADKFEKVGFILAGEGELTEDTKAFARQLGLENKTFFLGRCAQIAELLSVSDICALSSISEGFPNSVLEYMAASKPVVATRVGGLGEAIVEGETGFLVESGDAQAMANRLLELLQNPEKAHQFGKQGRQIIEKKFTVEAQLTHTLSLYRKLLK